MTDTIALGVTDEQEDAACEFMGCDDKRDLHREHDLRCGELAKLLAARDRAAELREREACVRAMTAKPGDKFGDLQVVRKGVENGCFGWWAVDVHDGRQPTPQGFISLPNLIAVIRGMSSRG